MPWVSVPVPEEHVQEVMEFVIRTIARASLQDWDDDSMETFFAKCDEPSRALISVVARAANAGKDLTDQMAADFIELTVREMYGLQREVNEEARRDERPALIIASTIEEPLPNGRFREKRVLTMSVQVAKLVREAERTVEAART